MLTETITLEGGWDAAFTSSSSYTTVAGSITITQWNDDYRIYHCAIGSNRTLDMQALCHPEPGPELDSGSNDFGISLLALNAACSQNSAPGQTSSLQDDTFNMQCPMADCQEPCIVVHDRQLVKVESHPPWVFNTFASSKTTFSLYVS